MVMSPAIDLSKVDLPLPERPKITVEDSDFISRLILSRTVSPSRVRLTSISLSDFRSDSYRRDIIVITASAMIIYVTQWLIDLMVAPGTSVIALFTPKP